ncbi:MAG: tetratricopeptide repeat protein [Pyrinomonadaceae bacterium]
MIRKTFLTAFILSVVSVAAFAQNNSTDTIMVLPFENTSKEADFNWVGESIADSLTDLLAKDRSLSVISNQERKIGQQRLKMPASVLPSLAASLKLARESRASLLVSGTYNIIPEKDDVAASVTVKAKIILVREGRFMIEEFPDGTRKIREIDLTDALGNLQSVQGQLAYQILLQRDSQTLPFTLNEFIESANKVPARAFEAYIKGLLTPSSDSNSRANYFINAIRIYDEDKSGELYVDAALELAHLYLNDGKYQNAIAYFSRIPEKSVQYPEAAFYSGLINWRQKDYEQSLAVLRPLADDLQLTSVYNALGAIATEASRTEKDKGKSAAFLTDGLEYLSRAAESAIDDPNILFNYGFALFLHDDYKLAAEKLRPVLANDPRDGEAYFLLAKSLEKLGDDSAKEFDNQARRFLTDNNKYASLESNAKNGKFEGINLRVHQPTRREFVSVVLTKERVRENTQKPVDETAALLQEAQKEFESGRDDEAVAVLRRVLVSEPMSAQAYLLLGKIHLKRGDVEQAISSFKAAYFWSNQLIEAHILLGRIYIQKRDCLQAKNYLVSALAIDQENEDARALERQVERCSK